MGGKNSQARAVRWPNYRNPEGSDLSLATAFGTDRVVFPNGVFGSWYSLRGYEMKMRTGPGNGAKRTP